MDAVRAPWHPPGGVDMLWLFAVLGCGTPDPVADALDAAAAVAADHDGDDLGLCDYEKGWGYAALRALNAAGTPEIASRAAADPRLARLNGSDLFFRWKQAREAVFATDEELLRLYAGQGGWYASTGVPRDLRLAPDGSFTVVREEMTGIPPMLAGQWRVADHRLQLVTDAQTWSAELRAMPYGLVLDADELGRFNPEPHLLPLNACSVR